jgi:hypothetical protein
VSDHLNLHSIQPIKLSKALAVILLILQASIPLEETQKNHFSPDIWFKQSILCKFVCHFVTKTQTPPFSFTRFESREYDLNAVKSYSHFDSIQNENMKVEFAQESYSSISRHA